MNEYDTNKIVANAKASAVHGDKYDKLWRSDGWFDDSGEYSTVRKAFIDLIMKKYIHPEPPFTILDLGCGTGWLSAFLSRYGQTTGVDFAPETVKAAQKNYGTQAQYYLADPQSPTLGLERTFDMVVNSEVIEHVEDHQALISQIAAFLKPNGWLMLTTPNKNYWENYRHSEKFAIWGQPIENWLTPGECIDLLKNNGFTICWREGWPDNGGYTLLNKFAYNRYTRKLAKLIGCYHHYARLLLPVSLFQMVLAQRR